MIFEFNGYVPVIHESTFIHPQANVTGNVVIGKNVYVGPGATLRGDWGGIVIEDGCNIQENCTIHMFPGTKVHLKCGAHIGHGAVIHGATIGENCLIGMNSVIMDECDIGSNCIVGALCFIPSKMNFPDRKVIFGNPAKIIKNVTQEMLNWKNKGTALYQKLPNDCFSSLKECLPLKEIPKNRPYQKDDYKIWKETQKNR